VSSANLTGYDFTAAPTQTVAYTWSDLGDVITDPQGYGLPVAAVRLVDAGGTPVAGYIRFGNSVGSEQYAGALKYDSGWPPVGTNPAVIPSDLPDGYPFTYRLSLAASGSKISLATRDESTIIIRESDSGGAWSANLADGNFGIQGSDTDTPKEVEIAYLNGELYAAQITSAHQVKVLQWNGSTWAGVGGSGGVITTSGEVWDLAFENLDGTLYVAYTEDLQGSDGYNDMLTIVHWDGSSWQTDITWSQNYLDFIRLARANGQLRLSRNSIQQDPLLANRNLNAPEDTFQPFEHHRRVLLVVDLSPL